MKKFFTLLFLALTTTLFAQQWKNDKAHSKIGFSITHLLISEVEGSFRTFDVTVNATKDDLSDAVFEATIDAASIDTDVEGRDKDLRGAKYFDVEKFPQITFKSTSFKKAGEDKYTLTGDITMKGVTKPVTFDVTMKGPAPHPFNKKMVAGIKATATINRVNFGVGGAGNAIISEAVNITVNGELVKQ